ncbi:protein downstream neighbor of son homolog [Osmerus eperlanus]|uniref:protein downstream neighbor of son homolog n=1 Tax=Osmerus eperlanus TaxID=29151 RepID=UPI002E104EFE
MSKAGYSPSFKRPAEILRMRRKRARSEGVNTGGRGSVSSPGQGASGVRPFSPGPLFSGQAGSGAGVKRRNPFASIENTYNSPKKRLVIYNDEDAAGSLGKPLGSAVEGETSTKAEATAFGGSLPFSERLILAEKREPDVSVKKQPSLSEDDSLFEEDEDMFLEERTPILKSPQAGVGSSIAPPVCVEYPADWSLKTRLLFTSPLSFSWAEQPKAQEEAQGLSQHCRAEYSALPQSIQDPRSCAELRSGFQQCLQYWQHPSLPWMSLFPRIGAERSFMGKNSPWAQDPALQQCLMSEWSVSLSSLYSLLKARLCPYFYLCSYQFTALFRAAGLGGSSSISALLSPTTRGLREAMKAEGIEFTMPLLEERRRRSKEPAGSSQDTPREQEEHTELSEDSGKEGLDDDDDDEDDGGFSWLTEMGVQDQIKKPDNISIKLRKERDAVCLDHRPESVVCVEGTHTFTLINFLINCKSVVAGAGSQAGLPPTLLAPTPFKRATLRSLKARSVNVKTQVRSGYQDVCSLEVTGPIMPHCLHAVTRLLRPAQRGGFSTALYTHEPTAVFNTHTATEPVQQPVELGGCGLHPGTVQQLLEPSVLGKSALRQLHMNSYSYSWKA